MSLDFPGMFEHVLTVLPGTRRVVVIMGSSPLERFWRGELGRESERFVGRLEFVWFDGLSLQEILERSSNLPDHSVIFFPLFSVDGAGVAQSQETVLTQLHARANAPIFGLYDFQVGRGIVGGPLVPTTALAGRAAEVARRLLRGESPSTITTAPMSMTAPTYDWRELQRWGISEARLPPESTVQFRQPSMWGQYRDYLVATAVVFALQTALIAGLVIQRARRRRTELALRDSERRFRETAERNQDLAGRLINAQEEERSRIARDLHDDLSQQLAGVSMMLSDIDSERVGTPTVQSLQGRVSALARNVRSLSHELHPGVLEHAGLVMTLRRHCAELAHRHRLEITFSAGDNLDSLGADDRALPVSRRPGSLDQRRQTCGRTHDRRTADGESRGCRDARRRRWHRVRRQRAHAKRTGTAKYRRTRAARQRPRDRGVTARTGHDADSTDPAGGRATESPRCGTQRLINACLVSLRSAREEFSCLSVIAAAHLGTPRPASSSGNAACSDGSPRRSAAFPTPLMRQPQRSQHAFRCGRAARRRGDPATRRRPPSRRASRDSGASSCSVSPVRRDHRALDHVLELADVARPRVAPAARRSRDCGTFGDAAGRDRAGGD